MKDITIFSGDITKLCRLCLKKSTNLIDLYSHSHKLRGRIVDVIERCTPVRIGIRHEKLTNVICKQCCIELDRVQFFLNKVLESERLLENYLQQLDSGYESTKDVSIKHESIDSDDTNRCWIKTNADQDTRSAITSNQENGTLDAKFILNCEYPEQLVKTNIEETCHSVPLNAVKQEIDDVTDSMPSIADSSTIFESPKILQCEICNKIFKKAKYLNIHKRIHTGAKPKQLTKNRFSETFNNIPLNDLKQETVDVTNAMPSTADSRTTFMESESSNEKKILQCEVCNKIFAKVRYLTVHKRIHTGAKPFQCDTCGKSYGRQDNLKFHKYLHTGAKPFKCTVCSKCFSTNEYLRKHMMVHTGEKPYQCDICSELFIQLTQFKTHKMKHTGEKPFQCNVCGKGFTATTNLKKHKVVHTGEKPFQCDICDKSYTQMSHLKRHKIAHTGEKPYRCDICNKRYMQSASLKAHKRMHTGEKPYECEICRRCFASSSTLKSHVDSHSNKKNKYQSDVSIKNELCSDPLS